MPSLRKHPNAPKAAKSKAAGQLVRIIGGQWKRRKLPVTPGIEGLRPTPDRVRETLFNWLGQNLNNWHCVDVCAGTGVLGFEAASRGAAQVHMAERHPALFKQLQNNCKLLDAHNVHITAKDGLQLLKDLTKHQTPEQTAGIDLVFLDPPFDSDLYQPVLRLAHPLLTNNGFLYLEAARRWTNDELVPLGWQCTRHTKAGMVHAHLLQKNKETAP